MSLVDMPATDMPTEEIPGCRWFHLGDLASVTTGYMVSPRKLDGLWDILDFMTGESLYNLALPRASDECTPYLIQEYPFLKELEAELYWLNEESWKMWLSRMVNKYGEWFSVRPIHPEDHEVVDPITEARRMTDAEIIPVVLPDRDVDSTLSAN